MHVSGWVAYAISALVATVGENKLMPAADTPSIVINSDSGYVRNNASWILGRIVRDFDYWQDTVTRTETRKLVFNKQEEAIRKMNAKPLQQRGPVERITQAGLVISVYRISKHKMPGVPERDVVYLSGVPVCLLQLGVAAIPCGLSGDWGIFMLTIAGTLLALFTGALGQWKCEKWACRKDGKTFVLTKGNGSQHAILILGADGGLNLEDLASAQLPADQALGTTTRVAIGVLAMLWVLLLITAAGIEENTWYLLAVGSIGILHNVIVAGYPRHPSTFGVHLDFEDAIAKPKVMDALFEVEKRYPGAGSSMRKTFFPGTLRDTEKAQWADFKETLEARRMNIARR